MEENTATNSTETTERTKFCKHCGGKIPEAAVICKHCGCQVEEMKQAEQPSIVINNSNNNSNVNANTNMNGRGAIVYCGKPKNKWVAFLLCVFLGAFGVHKFYEGRVGMGLLYLFTGGLLGFGWIIDIVILLLKPNPYFVR